MQIPTHVSSFENDDSRQPAAGTAERRWLRASDGCLLGASRYGASGRARAHLVVAGAIGVPQGFYRRFAAHGRARRCTVWTLDYRGIGRSAPRSLRGFRADLLDWAALDLAAAVDAASAEARRDGVPLYVIGHSFGGHALGLLPDPSLVDACYTFGTGAGWHGWMSARERARVLALWHVVVPLIAFGRGYAPWRLLGMGENLPLGVYRQWKRWCRYPTYCFGDPRSGRAMRASYARVRIPIAAAAATDDPWSPPRSRDAFMAGYANASVTPLDLDPGALGLPPLGHLGYFRASARPLWDSAIDWLAAHPSRERVA
jgi:predicted alpha/beta hydrolase